MPQATTWVASVSWESARRPGHCHHMYIIPPNVATDSHSAGKMSVHTKHKQSAHRHTKVLQTRTQLLGNRTHSCCPRQPHLRPTTLCLKLRLTQQPKTAGNSMRLPRSHGQNRGRDNSTHHFIHIVLMKELEFSITNKILP